MRARGEPELMLSESSEELCVLMNRCIPCVANVRQMTALDVTGSSNDFDQSTFEEISCLVLCLFKSSVWGLSCQ